jgi:hypothetical protein
MPITNQYIIEAHQLLQEQREVFAKELSQHPESHIRRNNEPDAVHPTAERKIQIEESIIDLIRQLYGIKWQKISLVWDAPSRAQIYSGRYNSALSKPNNTLLDIATTAMTLWALAHQEVSDILLQQVTNATDNTLINITLRERATHWVDENDHLHREHEPAIVSSDGNQYFWHGTPIQENVYKNPENVSWRTAIKDPVFSLLGGFTGLIKNIAVTCIAHDGVVGLYEGGGQKTWRAEYAEKQGRNHTGYMWARKPSRFLHDPQGISGWVSNNVKTIAGAQRSLLRLKLTRGRDR